MDNLFIKEDGTEVILTEGEMKIVRALERLERLWDKHGGNLLLFNGDSLRYGGVGAQHCIADYRIKGDGGDAGDYFD